MWALSWSTGILLDEPSSCCSFILNSEEEEPPPVLLKSQPADHNAPFSPQGCSWSPFIKQESAPNTSTWGQCQSVSFRLHSPHLPCLSCGVSPRQPQSLQPVATPFSTTAITHLVTVLTKHLVLGHQQWSEPDRRHWGCWLPVTAPLQETCIPLSSPHPLSHFPPYPIKVEDSP